MKNLHPFLTHPGPLAFAHRGGAWEWPENTMASFAGAIDAGYRYLETDVHRTADGVLVAFHDDRLDRVTDRTGMINELPWSEIREARVGGTEPIPLFEEVLMTWPHARINIDPKADESVEPLVSLLRRCGVLDRVCIGAFSDARLRRMRAMLGPDLCTSTGPKETARLIAASRRVGGGTVNAQVTQVPVGHKGVPIVTKAFVDVVHSRDMGIHVWTIDDPAEMHRLLELGVDGIMTDKPLVLREVLNERAQWHPFEREQG